MKETHVAKKNKKLGQQRKLDKEQELEIFNLITQKRPFHLRFKLPYRKAIIFLWTRSLVMQLIKKKYDLDLTESGLVKYLTRWGFPKLDRKLSKQKQCDKAIGEWLDAHLEAVIVRSIAENAKVYWLGNIASVSMKAGLEQGKKFTYIPVISRQGQLSWLTLTGKFVPERQKMLLKSLIGQNYEKVFLIRNTLNHFNTPLIKDWLNDNKTAIEIFPPLTWLSNDTY